MRTLNVDRCASEKDRWMYCRIITLSHFAPYECHYKTRVLHRSRKRVAIRYTERDRAGGDPESR